MLKLANGASELSEEDQQLKSDLEMLVQRLQVCLTVDCMLELKLISPNA
jgi:hypothetical protein